MVKGTCVHYIFPPPPPRPKSCPASKFAGNNKMKWLSTLKSATIKYLLYTNHRGTNFVLSALRPVVFKVQARFPKVTNVQNYLEKLMCHPACSNCLLPRTRFGRSGHDQPGDQPFSRYCSCCNSLATRMLKIFLWFFFTFLLTCEIYALIKVWIDILVYPHTFGSCLCELLHWHGLLLYQDSLNLFPFLLAGMLKFQSDLL